MTDHETTHRQASRVILLVHSSQSLVGATAGGLKGKVDCSRDVINLQCSKTIKGSGGASFTLVARRNYLNLVFPNDVVNIYIDPGDGKRGFIRTFFGYVDKIDREETVGEQGQVSTLFHVTCTDFVKALDKTEIYFNPTLAVRKEFQDSFGQTQLGGGHALRTSGVVAHGTPAQFVENLLQLLLGFGTQWVFPSSYGSPQFVAAARQRRLQRAKSFIPQDVQNQLRVVFGTDIDNLGVDQSVAEQINNKQKDLNKQIADEGVTALPETYYTQQAALATLMAAEFQLQAYQNLLKETQSSSSLSLLDLLSLDFIEALTIDGFISSKSVWTNQGTLSSFLYGWSNEIVNELCFDLRPVATGGSDMCFGSGYSTERDELGVNVEGTEFLPATVAAVQYAPAVVMREYPHSTVEGLDLSAVSILGSKVGFIPFGPIFSQQPPSSGTSAGRAIYNYESIGQSSLVPEGCTYAAGAKPQKHLDVVRIWTSDTTTSLVSRSDADIFNLFELYSQDGLQKMWKFELTDITPILTPVSIKRNGLRTRQLTTKFANYARDQLCHDGGGSAVDSGAIRRNLVRWALLLDHWYQHNIEYLGGTINLRGMPEIRVGYRLDWVDRNESYYVESVQHQWSIPGALRTTVQVSRGQRNDPFPAYIPPTTVKPAINQSAVNAELNRQGVPLPQQTPETQSTTETQLNQDTGAGQQSGGNRMDDGRLGTFFAVKNTNATRRSTDNQTGSAYDFDENTVDQPRNVKGYAVFPGDVPPTVTSDLADQKQQMGTPNFDSEGTA